MDDKQHEQGEQRLLATRLPQTEHLYEGDNLLPTLHQFQQTGHLCDVTVVASDGKDFKAHAGVLAATSSFVAQILRACDRGIYTLILPLNAVETDVFIQFAYTGQKNVAPLCDLKNLAIFCEKSNTLSHDKRIITNLDKFADNGLFCNMALYNAAGVVQPTHSYIMAAKYDFISQHIKSESIVYVTISDNKSNDAASIGKYIRHNDPNSFGTTSDIMQDKHRNISDTNHKKSHHKSFAVKPSDNFIDLVNEPPSNSATSIMSIEKEKSNHKGYVVKTSVEIIDLVNEPTFNSAASIEKYISSLASDDSKYLKKAPNITKYRYEYMSDEEKFALNPSLRFINSRDRPKMVLNRQRHDTTHKPYVCDICSKCFRTKGNVVSHKRVHTDEKPFQCTICPKSFKMGIALEKHLNVHVQEKLNTCRICQKSFKTSNALKAHTALHGEKPFKCDICNKKFKHNSSLIDHEAVHAVKKAFTCYTCRKRFSTKNKLKDHEALHIDGDQHFCDICKKGFKHKSTMVRHRRSHMHKLVHSDNKPYTCITCHIDFTTRRDLEKHQRSDHTDVKTYECSTCESSFKTVRDLKSHERIHSHNKCSACNKCFGKRTEMRHRECITHTDHISFVCDQ